MPRLSSLLAGAAAVLSIFLIPLFPVRLFASGGGEYGRTAEAAQFAILIKNGDESWYRKEAEGFTARCRELGVVPVVMDNRTDPNITLANVDLVFEKKFDGFAVAVPDYLMGPIIAARAFETNTPLVSLDHKLLDRQGRQLAPHIGVDDQAAGYTTGVWLAREVQKQQWYPDHIQSIGIAAFISPRSAEYPVRVNECRRALFEWLPEMQQSGFFRLESPSTDAVGGLLAMQELLNQHPELLGWIVIAATDESASGAVRALEQIGLGRSSIACGVQAERIFSEFSLSSETALRGAAFFDPVEIGRKAADALYMAVTNQAAIPAVTTIPYEIVTRGSRPEAVE